MRASFFPPVEPEPEPPERPVAPPWVQHPQDELPARVLVREFLAQTPGTALILSEVDVYSTGIRINISWELRRLGGDDSDWNALLHAGFGRRDVDPSAALRFGVGLSNGTVVTTMDRGIRSWNVKPDGWSLVDQIAGSGGDDRRYSGTSALWLWPLPPPGPIEFVGEWGARGVSESRFVLDATALLSRASEVRSLWP